MIVPIRLYKVKRIFINQRNFFLSFIITFILLIIVLVIFGRYNQQKKEVDLLNNEVKMLNNRYDTLKFNKTITEDQIKEYNLLLASLVPETEDFFSIIYALEQISLTSNFQITDYVIDVAKITREKLTLTVEGKGNTDDFLKFLQEYQFAGGRLITSDKIQYGGTISGSTKITLNFYSKSFTFNETMQIPKLLEVEIKNLSEIKKKIKFQFSTSNYQTVETNYKKTTNPFQGE